MTELLVPGGESESAVDTRIAYVIVQDATVQRYSSIFRLVPEANIRLLRCFMTAAFLPGGASRIRAGGRPFTEAAIRVQDLPQIRIAGSHNTPDETLWAGMTDMPLVVLMVGEALPVWAETLAVQRPVVVLSQDEAVLRAAEGLGMFPGLLAGKEDLREFYRALQKLCATVSEGTRWSPTVREAIAPLGTGDLFGERSRLNFVPPMALPPTDQGRSAAYLYNRLSISVDEPSLAPSASPGSERFFRVGLRRMLWACRVLSLVEPSTEPPASLGISPTELADRYAKLVGNTDPREKYELLLRLGGRINDSRPRAHLVTVPIPRRDLVRGHVPDRAEIAPEFKRWSGVRLKAVKDLAAGHSGSWPSRQRSRSVYDNARDTLLYEDRLLACQAAALAARIDAEPSQIGPAHSLIQNDVANLNRRIEARHSNKVAALFASSKKDSPASSLRTACGRYPRGLDLLPSSATCRLSRRLSMTGRFV